jgi:hypothetical protein
VYLTSLPRSEDFNLPLVFLVRAALGDFSSHCFPRRQACLGFRCRIDFPVGSAPLGPSVPASIKYAARVFLSWLLICAGLCFAPVLICSAWTCSSVPRSVPLGPLFLPPPEICFAAWSLQQKPPAVLASSCLFHSATGDFSFLAIFSGWSKQRRFGFLRLGLSCRTHFATQVRRCCFLCCLISRKECQAHSCFGFEVKFLSSCFAYVAIQNLVCRCDFVVLNFVRMLVGGSQSCF